MHAAQLAHDRAVDVLGCDRRRHRQDADRRSRNHRRKSKRRFRRRHDRRVECAEHRTGKVAHPSHRRALRSVGHLARPAGGRSFGRLHRRRPCWFEELLHRGERRHDEPRPRRRPRATRSAACAARRRRIRRTHQEPRPRANTRLRSIHDARVRARAAKCRPARAGQRHQATRRLHERRAPLPQGRRRRADARRRGATLDRWRSPRARRDARVGARRGPSRDRWIARNRHRNTPCRNQLRTLRVSRRAPQLANTSPHRCSWRQRRRAFADR